MKKDTRLEARQIRILEDYFARSLGGETMEQIAKDNGISRKTLSLWKNSDHGKQLHADWKKDATRDAIPQYYDVLAEKALSGSYKHMELFAKIFELLPSNKQEITMKEEKPSGGQEITKEILEDIKERIKLYKNQQNNVVNFNRVADNDR
ncbi:phBC6A51 family helix-turn-helix protein [Heyndrickxia sporothermodurans]|uniref:phBC6A51 family helix-turn-helix protein n=1 Tax=Heyndrickxia sporothermodurans TaxID=46224 RepID=UPI002E211320|nr:phBC6A51 family helix-turn-helix protein [Heyndrickxia sporothermodurans]